MKSVVYIIGNLYTCVDLNHLKKANIKAKKRVKMLSYCTLFNSDMWAKDMSEGYELSKKLKTRKKKQSFLKNMKTSCRNNLPTKQSLNGSENIYQGIEVPHFFRWRQFQRILTYQLFWIFNCVSFSYVTQYKIDIWKKN